MSVSELKQACEAVVNASPSDYETACEVWTRVCTPQAVLAALKEADEAQEFLINTAAGLQCDLNTLAGFLVKGEREIVRTLHSIRNDVGLPLTLSRDPSANRILGKIDSAIKQYAKETP